MSKKADAFKEYQDAAMIDMVLDVMPRVCDNIYTVHVYCSVVKIQIF